MTRPHATALLLGDAMLDHDHAEMQRLIQALLEQSGDGSVAALDALRTASRAHFGREDDELRRLGGNNAVCHLDEHAAVLKSLDEVHSILCDPATPPESAQCLVASLSLELLRWLPEHVNEMDAGLAAVRCKSRFGSAPLMLVRRTSPESLSLA